MRTLIATLLIGAALGGCSRSHGFGAAEGEQVAQATYARERITAEEIAATQATNAYEVTRLLRPSWLAGRGPQSLRAEVSPYPVVYVDDQRMGGLEWLRTISAESVAEIRFVSASDATTRWGTGHPAGVILVLTRR
ncbi:MAG TPA: hypothetical protein VFS05_16645 [Gemmatimonadaceae bacterium]|nr:hypothetical protein [Gemmatimonadaceae bacterium]